jgi:hypothetical protein
MQRSKDSGKYTRRPGAREATIKILRVLRLNRVAARLYLRHFHGFDSASDGLDAVIHRCIRRAVESGIADRGDYYEFGVFKGGSFWQAQLAAQDFGIEKMRFFGFDSFEGLPQVRGVDDIEDGPFYGGQYAWPLELVKKELDKRGTDWERCFLIKGSFETTLSEGTRSQYEMRKASVVLIDCDLYESTAVALEFLKDKFVDGAILIMDDWNAFGLDVSRGERLALAEFTRANPNWVAEPWFPYGLYGQVFVMHRSSAARA